jgi:hypothetical protein
VPVAETLLLEDKFAFKILEDFKHLAGTPAMLCVSVLLADRHFRLRRVKSRNKMNRSVVDDLKRSRPGHYLSC